MEQQNSAPGAAVSQAARTVLPGEPFDPPAASQVPGPRPEQQQQAPAPVAQWNYEPAQPAYGAPTSEAAPIPGMTFLQQAPPAPAGYPADGGGDFASLHEYASLPVAQQAAPPMGAPVGQPQQMPTPQGFAPAAYPPPAAYPQPAPDSSWPPAAPFTEPQGSGAAYPAPPQQYNPADLPPMDAPLSPDPSAPSEEDLAADGGHRRSKRSIDKRLLALVGVVVIGGGGYFAYNQFGKSDSSTASTPVPAAAAPVAVRYDFPANVSGFKLQPAASSAALKTSFRTQIKTQFGAAAAASVNVASYSSGHPVIYAMTFRPGAAKVAADFKIAVAQTAAPDPGNVAVRSHNAVPGAAGGVMVCGGESGPNASSWCVWHNATTIGISGIEGSPKTQITEIMTRELRAYAEH